MSNAQTELVVNTARKAINDAVNHYFTYRVFGDDRLDAMDKFIQLLMSIQPHLMFTSQSLDEIETQMKNHKVVYHTVMNLTLFYYSRSCTSTTDDGNLIDHLVDSTDLMKHGMQDADRKAVSQDDLYFNLHAKKEDVKKKLSNNRFYVMLYVAVLFLNTEPILTLYGKLMAEKEKQDRDPKNKGQGQ